jgi:anti-sigma B factor antagonist
VTEAGSMDDLSDSHELAGLRVEVGGRPRRPRLHVHGEIDLASAPVLREELQHVIDAGALDVVLDLQDVSFVDSSGLGVLVGAHKRLREANYGSITIERAQDSVRKVFEITGLGTVFGLMPDD